MMDIMGKDGGVNRAKSVIEDCLALGHEVAFLCLTSGPPPECGFPVIAIPGTGPTSLLRLFVEVFKRARALGARTVILSSFGNLLNPWLALLLQIRGYMVLYDCQDPAIEMTSVLHRNGFAEMLSRGAVSLFDGLLAANIDSVLSVSPGVDALLISRGWSMPIFRFYNCNLGYRSSDESQLQPLLPLRAQAGWEDAVIVIYSGGLQPLFRGIEEQIAAVAHARQNGRNVKLAIFGYGSPEPFRTAASEAGISDHIYFGGSVTREQLRGYFGEASCAILNMLPFALPTKLFEYLVAGLDVFCSAAGKDVLAVCGDLVVPYTNSAELADLLRRQRARPKKDPVDVEILMRRLLRENRANVANALKDSD